MILHKTDAVFFQFRAFPIGKYSARIFSIEFTFPEFINSRKPKKKAKGLTFDAKTFFYREKEN